jgi:hypothetical protein
MTVRGLVVNISHEGISQGPQPVKTANSGRFRLPIRQHTGPLDERPIVGENVSSYEPPKNCQDRCRIRPFASKSANIRPEDFQSSKNLNPLGYIRLDN